REVARFVQRRRTTDVVLQQLIELAGELRILARREVAFGQRFDWRDQRLGHEPPAVRAKVSARVGIAASEHRTIGACFLRCLAHWRSSNARRAFATKRVTLSISLMPGADSTPDDTSTPNGWTARIARVTFSGVSPPARTTRRRIAAIAAGFQFTTIPVPPRCSGSTLSISNAVSGPQASHA